MHFIVNITKKKHSSCKTKNTNLLMLTETKSKICKLDSHINFESLEGNELKIQDETLIEDDIEGNLIHTIGNENF